MNGPHEILQDSDVQALISYLEHESAPMIVMNTNYDILAANTAYQREFGVAGTPYVGRKCYAMSHHYDRPCDQAGEHCPMRNAFATHAPDRVLHIHHTPRGPEHVDVELRPIVDARHQIVGFVERLQTVRHASAQPSSKGLVGSSPAFNRSLGDLQRVAASDLPVLLLGESGTGKELFARAVHEGSGRSRGPFVVVDCSGLTETLFESELFGYERGAFTGASHRKPGLVETAKGGTLFLDEIGDVPLSMQVKLLRLIESGAYRRVGGVETLQADFRLVAATHKPLREMVANKVFRDDLYYRISAFPIRLPPLRERREDIPMLVESLLARSASASGKPMHASDAALAMLMSYDWPGNIRELRNVLDRARLFADDGELRPEYLNLDVSASHAPGTELRDDASFRDYVKRFKGSRKELASALGMSERSLYRRLKLVAAG
ncbi:PAS domain-containing protein [Massilia sp. NEAU-DD11]|uniref:PAS domain-containing protein n=1 Tax=Massilia cellulosiltytica TaxID=2683234 RepID=A0A7X3G163_9BURK|nr:sigma 54-interacting transcriptional regulator [Telluria cellulosilytica]MVW61555.1 PAS domain-containing protein [Telluria cellulosilytica]